METKDKNAFYHSKEKGCTLVPAMKLAEIYKKKNREAKRMLHFSLCTTHGVDICRCGWQFTKHPVNQQC